MPPTAPQAPLNTLTASDPSSTVPTPANVYVREYISRPTVAAFIAGGVAGAVSRTVVSPLERLKILFQVQGPGNASYQGIGSALLKMWREEGWRGLLRYPLVQAEP